MTITNGYLTADEFRAYITPAGQDLSSSGPDDAVIDGIITAVSRYFDNATGSRTYYARTETHYYDTPYYDNALHGYSYELLINDDDLLTVTSLVNGDGAVIPSTKYTLLPLNSSPKYGIRLDYFSNAFWLISPTKGKFGAITVTGTWGYMAAPTADIKQAVMDIAKSAYSRRYGDNVSSSAIITAGGYVIEPRDFSETTRRTIAHYNGLT